MSFRPRLGTSAQTPVVSLIYVGRRPMAAWLNPIVAGWMNYYGRFHRSELNPLLWRVNTYLRRWAGRKYRRLRRHTRFKQWWAGLQQRAPGLFAHWRWVRNA